MVHDVREGRSVILKLPSNVPAGLARAARDSLEPMSHFRRVEVRSDVDPVTLLYQTLVADEVATVRSISSLLREPDFQGWVVWLDGLDCDVWPQWDGFLTQFQHASGSLDPLELTALVVVLQGKVAVVQTRDDARLTTRVYDGQVSELDAQLYASIRLADRALPRLQKQMSSATIASLALWDPAVADELAAQPFSTLFDPDPILSEMRAYRDWPLTDGEETSVRSWAAGRSAKFEGAPRWHSAAIPSGAAARELRYRIWKGQVVTLLPFVEEARRQLLCQYADILEVPYVTQTGHEVTDALDLEIGHIARQLQDDPRVEAEMRTFVSRLWKVRNRLAHLEPVGLDLIPSGSPLDRTRSL